MLARRSAALVATALLFAGCVAAPPSAPQQAASLCAGSGLTAASSQGGKTVVASFPSTVQVVLAWAAKGRSPEQVDTLTKLPGDAMVAFCYVDGDYSGYPQPPGGHVDYTRALYLVPAAGDPIQYWVGPSTANDLVGPDKANP
jgi:hypothetical protein